MAPNRPLSASEVADKLSQVRSLIALSQTQHDKAKHDSDVARIVLLDLEGALLTRGLAQ